MLAVESSASDMLRLLPLAYDTSRGASSFHHSDSLAFNISESSMDFDPTFDEATIPVNTMVKPESAVTSIPESSIAERVKLHQDLSSSWPCNKNQCKAHADKTKQKKKQQRRRSMLSSTPSYKKPRKPSKVRFSPTLEVRTHSIVLGDHPFCEDGLALELGWDYEDSRDICGCGVEHKPPRWRRLIPNYPYPKRCLTPSPPRHLSAVERKRLLLEVGDCSETEIRLRQFQTRILLQVQQLQLERQQPVRRSSRNKGGNKNGSIPESRLGSPSKPLYAAMA